MTEHSNDLKSRLVTGFERDGRRRRFDPQAKLELVQACMQPGVSVARMALDHAVNANLLRKWIRDYERERDGAAASKAIESQAPAFVPVVTVGEVAPVRTSGAPVSVRRSSHEYESAKAATPARLSAQLPNGVTLRLECAAHDGALVRALIEALGAN